MNAPRSALLARFKAAVDGVGYAMLGENFEGFLDQEIRNADAGLRAAREKREEAKAVRIHAQQHAAQARTAQKELEEQALKLLRGHRKAQARALATDIAARQAEHREWEGKATDALAAEATAQTLLEQRDRRLKLLRQQLGAFKASASLQRTQEALARGEGAPPETALTPARRARQGKAPAPAVPPPERPGDEGPDAILARLEATLKKTPRATKAHPRKAP